MAEDGEYDEDREPMEDPENEDAEEEPKKKKKKKKKSNKKQEEESGTPTGEQAKAGRNFLSQIRADDVDFPIEDPFMPGSTMPRVDPVPSMDKKKKQKIKERILGKTMAAQVGMRVWLKLGARGLGVLGEEGLGSVIQVDPVGECVVKWDSTGQTHVYSCGRYNVSHLAIFDYMERKEWMIELHEMYWKKHNRGRPPRIEKEKELEVLLGYRLDEQLKARVSYVSKSCSVM